MTQNHALYQKSSKASLKIASLNIKGRRCSEIDKWMHIPQLMHENNFAIVAVQETHLTDDLADQFKNLFSTRLTLHFSPDPHSRNVRGVTLVLNKKHIKTENVKEMVIIPGRAIPINVPWQDNKKINILAIYAPNVLEWVNQQPRHILDWLSDQLVVL